MTKRFFFIPLVLISTLSFLPSHGADIQAPDPLEAPPPVAAPVAPQEILVEKASLGPQQSLLTIDAPAPAGATGDWIPQGPGPTLNGQAENVPGNNPVVGAVGRIVAHPTNANIFYLGGVNGGVWRTTNATAANPHWIPLTDQFPSLSIGALEFDPSDATNQTLVAGIGRFSSLGGRGGPLTGLLRTTDGGSTWAQLGQVDLAGRNISGVGPRGNTILVAANGGTNPGMYRSTDGGANFQFISGINGLNTGPVFDLAGDPSNQNRLYAGVSGVNGGVFRTDDAGANWTDVTDAAIGALVGGTTNNIKLAVHNNTGAGTNAVYFALCNTGQLAGIFRSANAGGAWTAMDLPQTNEAGNPVGIHPGGQCGTHLSLVADPTNTNIVYVGGDRQPEVGPDGIEGNNGDGFPNSIGANTFSGRLFRGDAGVAPTGGVPSPQWTPLTHNGTAGNSAPHADSRDMAFDANGNIIEGDDGGIYRRTNPQNNTGNWFSLINDLQVTELHDVAYDTNSNILIGGAQDTGTPQQTTSGGTTWNSVSQADGGDVAVDNITLAGVNQSIRYSSTQNLGGFRRQTFDANNNQVGATVNPALTVIGGGAALVRQFITPVELNAIDPTRLIIGGSNSTYESLDQGNTITEVGPGIGVNSIPGAVAYGGRIGVVDNPDVLYVGSGNQVFVRTTAGGALNAAAALPAGAGAVQDIALDPTDWRTAYVLDSNQVFVTNNAGANWTDITGNLADVNLRAVVFVPGLIDFIFVGGGGGVFAMRTNNPGAWGEAGVNLPQAPVFDLVYDRADNILVASTLGRGAWILQDVTIAPQIQVPGSIVFSDTCVGSTSTKTLNVCNTGNTDLVVGPITSSDGQFVVPTPSSGYPVVISPDFCFPFQVRFTPTSVGGKSATLTIPSNDPSNPSVQVQVSGNVPPGDIRVTGSTDFGDVCVGAQAEKTISVCNVGACNLNVTSVAFEPACADFTLVNNPFPATVSHDSCNDIVIRFTPTSAGPKSCTLVIRSDDPDSPIVTKTVTANTPSASIDVPPDQSFLPEVIQSIGSCQTKKPFPISNTGTCNLKITNVAIGGVNGSDYGLSGLPSFPVILQPGHIVGEGNLNTVFAPTALDRDRIGSLTVTYESDSLTHATTSVTRALCGEGVNTGARVLVQAGGVPLATVEKIQLQRINANRNKNQVDTNDVVQNAKLQTVTPGGACTPFKFHREYGTVSNPIQLLPGSYLVTATAVVGGKRQSKTVAFDVTTCDFNPTVIVNF